MRAVSLAFLLSCGIAAGCGGGNTSPDAAKNPDLSVASGDMRGVVQPDLSSNMPDLSANNGDMRTTTSPDLRTGTVNMAGGGGDMATGATGATVTVGPVANPYTYSPDPVTIKVGQAVKWTWATGSHDVVSGSSFNGVADNKFCSPNNTNCGNMTASAAGATFTVTFTTAGIYTYFSDIGDDLFQGMAGTINVTN